jgi:hypothetical protein
MKVQKSFALLFALLTGGLFLFTDTSRAEQAPIRWVVKNDQEVNRLQAERLYFEAARRIALRHGSPQQKLRPPLVIRVGEPCPDPEINEACLGSLQGELYIPEWNEASPGYVVQAALKLSLLALMPREELEDVTLDVVTEDVQNFLDVYSALKPN